MFGLSRANGLSSCTNELTAVGTACTSPEPSQATQEAHSERGGRLDIPFLAEKLLSSNSLWGGLFLRCGSWLVDQVPVDDHTFMNTWAVQFGHYGLTKENNERELSRQWTGVDLGGLGEGGKYDKKNTLYKILKGLIKIGKKKEFLFSFQIQSFCLRLKLDLWVLS